MATLLVKGLNEQAVHDYEIASEEEKFQVNKVIEDILRLWSHRRTEISTEKGLWQEMNELTRLNIGIYTKMDTLLHKIGMATIRDFIPNWSIPHSRNVMLALEERFLSTGGKLWVASENEWYGYFDVIDIRGFDIDLGMWHNIPLDLRTPRKPFQGYTYNVPNLRHGDGLDIPDRVLLQIAKYSKGYDGVNANGEISQFGMVRSLKLHQPQISNALKSLLSNKLIKGELAYVPNATKKHKVYIITKKGLERVKELKKRGGK